MLFTGLCIGLAEELVTRGLTVNLLRRAGYGEKAVILLSSLIFALMHSVNALSEPRRRTDQRHEHQPRGTRRMTRTPSSSAPNRNLRELTDIR